MRDLLGVLNREWPVRILNCSSSGCLIESAARVDVGTIGSLTLTIDGRDFVDDVQVVRCLAIEGSAPVYHVGARFLWTSLPRSGSIRSVPRLMATDRSRPFETNLWTSRGSQTIVRSDDD
jgi:hypothetical protein